MATRLAVPAAASETEQGEVVLEGVTRRFGDVVALDGVSLRVHPDEVVAVVGPSGSGKSTLLDLVCGLQAPDGGAVSAARAVLMPQSDLLLPWLDPLDNAALPLRIAGVARREARARAHTLLRELGLDGFERARTWELSGGMRQRVAVARTLLSGAPILCLDEPFGALDAITRADIQAWLAQALEREPRTVLLVTHDVEEAALLADRVLVLSPRPGHVVAELPVELPRAGRTPGDPQIVAVRAQALAALRSAMAGDTG
jgi:ABC-type nitrate/sulfonate/bicarbonate transport system ATPase subunit